MLFVLTSVSLSAQVFVDSAATGLNDGSSWANAYTELYTALDSASADDSIFIASGTYFPDTTLGRTAHFSLQKDLNVYGGFAGTETNLSDRTPGNAPTILQGDVLGDDVDGDAFLFKEDNLYQLLKVSSAVTESAILDHLVFQGGYAAGPTAESSTGAAIYLEGSLRITNCRFENNVSIGNGAAISVTGQGADPVRIESSTFEDNTSTGFGGALYVENQSAISVFNSIFRRNTADFNGGAIRFLNTNGQINLCRFEENEASRTGGAISLFAFDLDSMQVDMLSCSFTDNLATFGGGIWLGGTTDDNEFQIIDCEFTGNRAIYLISTPGAEPSGGAFGAEYAAVGNPVRNKVLAENCFIYQNEADSYGGGVRAVYNGGNENQFILRNCVIRDNESSKSGGGLQVDALGAYAQASIERCEFRGNKSPEGLGVYVGRLVPSPFSQDQNIVFSNCTFTEHDNLGQSNPVFRIYYANATLYNCTIAWNSAEALSVRTNGKFSLQNSLFHNPGYRSYADTLIQFPAPPRVFSLGGNMTSDSTLKFRFSSADFYNTDPLLVPDSLGLALGSPAVDMGVMPDSAYDADRYGNIRTQGLGIDIGAVESPFTTSTLQPGSVSHMIEVFPHPVSSQAKIRLRNPWQGEVSVRIMDVKGSPVWETTVNKSSTEVLIEARLDIFPSGLYLLQAVHDDQVSTRSLMIR